MAVVRLHSSNPNILEAPAPPLRRRLLFMPEYQNRTTAVNTYRRIFNHFLQETGLKKDKDGNDRSPYSLRHYALQTRLVKSDGKVNIYWLAENAGTSVDQLERFYLKNLAPSAAKVRNIQSFGD